MDKPQEHSGPASENSIYQTEDSLNRGEVWLGDETNSLEPMER